MTYVYITRPRQVGSKHGKSMVVGIPSEIVKTYNINKNTAFELEVDESTETVTLRKIRGLGEKNPVSCGKSVQAPSQQRPSRTQ